MKLVDMKLAEGERPSDMMQTYQDPEYPYDLQLHLSDVEFAKLGIPRPEAGARVMITAEAKVMHSGANTGPDDADPIHEHCCLQITAMAVEPPKPPPKSAGARVYGE